MDVEYTVSFQTPERKGVKKRDKQINGQSNDTPAINKGNRIKDPSKGKENNIIKGAPKYSSKLFQQKVLTKTLIPPLQHKIINDFKIITPEYATNSQASTHRIWRNLISMLNKRIANKAKRQTNRY